MRIRLYPVGAILFGLQDFAEDAWTLTHHGEFPYLGAFIYPVFFLSMLWLFISVIVVIGVRHLPTRILAGFLVAEVIVSLPVFFFSLYGTDRFLSEAAWVTWMG